MASHDRRPLRWALLLLFVTVPVQAQIRAPWGPRPIDDEAPARRHSIVTVWTEALDSLSHPNPILRWHAARVAAAYPDAFDDETLMRAWLRERELLVRVALKRTLISRGKGDDLVRLGSTNPATCAGATHTIRQDELRAVPDIIRLLKTSPVETNTRALCYELALALRTNHQGSRENASGLRALLHCAPKEEALLLRAIARDTSATASALRGLDDKLSTARRMAVAAVDAYDDPAHGAELHRALKKESNFEVARALLRALRERGVELPLRELAELEQRVHGANQVDDGDGRIGYQLESTRAILASAKPHDLLHEQAQRRLRQWLSPTSPIAGLVIHVLGEQPNIPVFTVAPYIDDARSYVRATAARVITARTRWKDPLRQWLKLDAVDSQTFERLLEETPRHPPEPNMPRVLLSAEPLLISWEHGHELTIPAYTGVHFEHRSPGDATACRPEHSWLSFEDQIRDL